MHIRKSLVVPLALFSLLTTICHAQTVRRWDFNTIDDREGWEVRPRARGVVMGGSLWLSLTPTPKMSARFYEGIGDPVELDVAEADSNLASSPRGLNINAEEVTQVRLKILNLSPVTDFYLLWRASGQDWGTISWNIEDAGKPPARSKRCTLQPDLKQWQEVICSVDGLWQGTIDQIAIRPLQFAQLRGDLWIGWIEISSGPPQLVRARPDVASPRVIPKITVPGISQAGFSDAFKVLDQCLVVDVPMEGFTYPYMGAGGYYGEHWWSLDTSLNVSGAKWANQSFAEGVMRGFRAVQALNPDGHIDGAGHSFTRGQIADWSQTPRFFEVAYDVARRTNDAALRVEIYATMRQFLDWWVSPTKRDEGSGLIVGLGEDIDTLGEIPGWRNPPAVAPVDLNVAVAVGAELTAQLAADLGKKADASRYQHLFLELARAIEATLWDEKDGVYYNYDLTEHRPRRRAIASMFDPLRLGIAAASRRDRLIRRLLDPNEFNWGRFPLTSLAMTDPGYVEVKGNYGVGSWAGDVWTYRNIEVIKGLEDAGRPDLAAELDWATIKEFHANYREFLLPSTGEGQGAKGYGFSASQYIEAIIEHLFGVDFDAIEHRVRVAPHVPQALYGKDIALEDLILPTRGDTRLSIHIKQSSATAAIIGVNVSGTLPEGDLVVVLPGIAKEHRVSMRRSFTAKFQ